jgi:hypothetical protein
VIEDPQSGKRSQNKQSKLALPKHQEAVLTTKMIPGSNARHQATNIICERRDKFLSVLTAIMIEDERWNARRAFRIDSDRGCCFGK